MHYTSGEGLQKGCFTVGRLWSLLLERRVASAGCMILNPLVPCSLLVFKKIYHLSRANQTELFTGDLFN